MCRELRGKFKHLAQLLGAEQYEQFISSLKKEQQLTHRLQELVQYRKNGITRLEGEPSLPPSLPPCLLYTWADCSEFDALKREFTSMQSEGEEDLFFEGGLAGWRG